MPFEVGQHQKGVVVLQVFAHKVLRNGLAVRDRQLHVGALGIHQVEVKILVPPMDLNGLEVFRCGVPLSVVGGVALGHSAAHGVNNRLPEGRTQEILVSHLAGMNLDGHLAGQVLLQKLI